MNEAAYEARYGWNRQSALVIAGCGAFCLAVLVLPAPLWLRVTTIGFFGLGGLVIVAAVLTRKTALRVDESGVTMNASPLSARPARFYPWEDVDAVVIWQYNRLKKVGIVRRDGAAPLLNRPLGGISRAALDITSPDGLPYETAATAVSASGWFLRTDVLTATVARFAPDVPVFDLTGDPSAASPVRGRRVGPVLRPPRVGRRQYIWAASVAASVLIIVGAGTHLGPGIRAAHGPPRSATDRPCGASRGGRGWTGCRGCRPTASASARARLRNWCRWGVPNYAIGRVEEGEGSAVR
jgi:hypothetical protein